MPQREEELTIVREALSELPTYANKQHIAGLLNNVVDRNQNDGVFDEAEWTELRDFVVALRTFGHAYDRIVKRFDAKGLQQPASRPRGTAELSPMAPSADELINEIFHALVDGEVSRVEQPTFGISHAVHGPDGGTLGYGRSSNEAKISAALHSYREVRADYKALREQVRSLHKAARELFDL